MNLRTFPLLRLIATAAFAQGRFQPGNAPFLAFDSPVVALTHVRVIDGTGAAPREDQTLVIDHGLISAATTPPAGARVLDLSGHTVIPGIVGMHEHLFYPGGGGVPLYPEQGHTLPEALPGQRRHHRANRGQRGAVSPTSTSSP